MKFKKFTLLLFVVQILCLCLIASIIAAASPVANNNLSLTLETDVSEVNEGGSTVVNAGETFNVTVNVDVNDAGFLFLQAKLKYDTTKLIYNGSTTEGSTFLVNKGAKLDVKDAGIDTDDGLGVVNVNIGDLMGAFASNPVKYDTTGLVATLSFTAVEDYEGVSELELSVDNKNLIDINLGYGENANIVLNAPANVVLQQIDPATHTHTLIDATCTTPKICSVCNATEGEALGHTWTDATCTTPKTCSVCNTTEGEALGHTEADAVVENKVEPDCKTAGSYDSVIYCSVCNDELSREQKSIEALGHDLEHHEAKAPTCNEIGWNAYDTCKRDGCDYTTYVELEALEHDLEHHEAKAPTCNEIGWNAYDTCKRDGCDYTTYVELEALGHDLENHEAKAPTCNEIGWNAYDTCKRDGCDYTTYVELEALGHTEADAVVENRVEPDCTTVGSYDSVIYCSVCNDELSREQKSLEALGHDLEHHEAKAPTCTEIGWNAYDTCKRDGCEYTTYVELEALGHTEADAVVENRVEPTCTVDGSYDSVVYCSVCDIELSRTNVKLDKLGHDLENHEAKAPTCTEIGWNAYDTCKRDGCDYTTYAELEALGHTWTDANCTTAKTCSVCNTTEGEALGHTWTNATCTAPKTCSVCNTTEGEALGHTWTDATCTTPKTCSVCNTTEGDAKGHTAVVDPAVEPTYSETGMTEGLHCSTCGEVFDEQQVIPEKSSAWIWIVVIVGVVVLGGGAAVAVIFIKKKKA